MLNRLRTNKNLRIYTYYTLIFAVAAILIFSPFMISHKSIIWYGLPSEGSISYETTDGLTQHYAFFVYIGRWLRSVIKAVFTLRFGNIPVFNFSIGFGDDVFAALHYYGIFNIFNLPAALFWGSGTELGFNLTFIFHLYLAGIFFIHYCLYNKRTCAYATITGALIYCFSLYTMYYATRQFSIFTMPLIYLPLLLNSLDILLKEGKPLRLVIISALASAANIYLMFMLGVFAAIYFMFRLIDLYHNKPFEMLRLSLTAVAAVVAGMLIACPCYIDLVLRVFNGSRLSTDKSFEPLLYSRYYYRSFIHDLISYNTCVRESCNFIGVTAIGLIGIILLFIRKGNKAVKLGFILLTLFQLTPVVSYVLNLCAHRNDRWVWAYIMLIAYICAVALPELKPCVQSALKRLKCRIRVRIIIYILLYVMLVLAFYDIFMLQPLLPLIAIVIAAVLYIAYRTRLNCNKLIICAVTVMLCTNSFKLYYDELRYIDTFSDYGYANSAYNSDVSDSTDRYDTYCKLFNLFNSDIEKDRLSTNYYLSFADSLTTSFKDSLALPYNIEQYNVNLDNRAFVQALTGVKYVATDKENCLSPYLRYDSTTQLYENTLALPPVIGYDSTISEEYLDSLEPIYRQEAMLQYAAVKNGDENSVSPTASNIDYTVKELDDKLVLSFSPQQDCELYLSCTVNNGFGTVTINCNDTVQRLELCNSSEYKTRDYTMINLGYLDRAVSQIELTKGVQLIDNIKLYAQPLNALPEYAERLKSGISSNTVRTANTLSGSLTLDKPKYVCFTVPYRDSAKLYINGKLCQTELCNKLFIGTSLPAGEYSFRLVYTLPNKAVKLITFILGVLICLILCNTTLNHTR